MAGEIVGACNCAWGCPCNFDAPPTYGHCDGLYTLVVHDGRFGDVDLNGTVFIFGGHSPGPIHEGGGEDFLIVDARAHHDQHIAIVTLWRGDDVGSPFDELASVNVIRHEPMTAMLHVVLDGIRSIVRVGGNATIDLALERIRTPVTGGEEELYLDKPTGFTSLRSELGTTGVGTVEAAGMTWDLVGRYAEHAEFSYAGP